MIQIVNEKINEIPILHVVKENLHNQKLPALIFIHGFSSAKEHNLHVAYLLAEKGYRVLLPDTLNHGERAKELSENEFQMSFWDIVVQTIHELRMIKDHYIEHKLIDEQRIGVAGTSMGGIITLGALTQYSWVSAAVSLMGCPSYQEFAHDLLNKLHDTQINIPSGELEKIITGLKRYDLSQQTNTIHDRPILFWHSKADKVVPFKYAWELYEELKLKNHDVNFLVDDEAGHKVPRYAVLETVSWITDKL